MNPTGSNPNNPGIAEVKQLVAGLARTGRANEAKQAGTALCSQYPNDPEAWNLLGAVHGSLQDFPNAEICCRNALALAPNHPGIIFNLAIAFARQGKNLEATEAFNRCIALKPDFADAYHELANTQASEGKYLAAIASYKNAIQIQPSCGLYHFNLGISYQNLKQPDAAAECYRRTIELDPARYDAYMELASIQRHNLDYGGEINTLHKAAAQFPDDAELQYRLGSAYRNNGESGIAQEYFENTLKLDQEHAGALTGIAEYLGLQGHYDEARKLLDEILARHPGNAPTVVTFAQFAIGTDRAGDAIELIKKTLEIKDLAEIHRSTLHTSLAALYESQGEPDLAFEHYRTGNRLKGEKFEYLQVQNTFYAAMSLFSAENLLQLPRSDNASTMPIFIVGMPRSGTTLTEQILASHPDVFGAGELTVMSTLAGKLPDILGTNQQYFLSLEGLDKTVLDRLADEYLSDITSRSQGERFVTDKMPSNFMHLGLIDLLFPGARVIHCVRDPLDTCLSCYFKNFRGNHPYAYDLKDLGNFYTLYQRLMAHWKRVIRLPIYEIRYENLVMDQANETRRLLEFCDLEWNDACLQFHKTARTVSTASHDQVRNPMYNKSIGRWRAYREHLGPLFEALNMTPY